MMKHKPTANQLGLFSEVTLEEPDSTKQNKRKTNAVQVKPKELIKLGDLFTIGRHRLLCGNSAELTDVKRLLGSKKVQLIHTDPPYNVRVQPQSKEPNSVKARKLVGDFISDADFRKLLNQWFIYLSYALEPGRAFYIWGGYSNITNYPPMIRAAGLYYSQAIIWVKSMSVFTRKDFMGQHEIAFYGWKEQKGVHHQWHGPNNATDVWTIPNVPRQQMIHLTEKPVEIPRRAIEYSSKPGEIVLDFFGGSGSTLVAAEESDRIAYLLEIDPLYCDVILDRCRQMQLPIIKE